MLILFTLSLLLCLGYSALIYYIYKNWRSQEDWQIPDSYKLQTKVSVILAVRNEADHIHACVESILDNDFSSEYLELIIVDDHSEDDTNTILQQFNHECLKILQLDKDKSGKKAAISYGIKSAKGEVILITDGDCIVPKNWIINQLSHLEMNNLDFSTGPVILPSNGGLLEQLQDADMAAMMAVTQAGIKSKKWFMANGANMCFRKSTFVSIDGFRENINYASGDDMFLVNRLAQRDASKIGFLKTPDAVSSNPKSTFSSFYAQRLRWATKNRAYLFSGVVFVLAFVFLFCLLALMNIIASSIVGIYIFYTGLFMLSIKMLVDYVLLLRVCKYFRLSKAMSNYFSLSILYVFYIVFIGLASIFVKRYNWKGRKSQ